MLALSSLHAALDFPAQTQLAVGAGSALLVAGWCFHPQERILSLSVIIGDDRTPITHHGLLRPDVQATFPDLIGQTGFALTSGFRAVVQLRPISQAQTIDIVLEAILESGAVVRTAPLKQIYLTPQLEDEAMETATAPIVICMPTYNPNPHFLRAQIASIQAQTVTDWLCLIQDDASDELLYEDLCALVADDPRFQVRRNAHNRGAFNNYERVLSRAPATAHYVIVCSQDNIWDSTLLEQLRGAFTPEVMLVTSDMRVIDEAGQRISPTFWDQRDFDATALDRLIIANTVSGASCMFRRELLADILPFPPPMPDLHDDHWAAMVALAHGRIAFLPQPLVSYRHHTTNVVGWVNIAPIDIKALTKAVRAWSTATMPTPEWQQAGLALAQQAPALTHKRLWAEILKQRIKTTPEKHAQLETIIQSDETPRALAAAIRARLSMPRVTLNLDWGMLYSLVVERLLACYGRQYWPHLQIAQTSSTSVPFAFGLRDAHPRLQHRETLLTLQQIYQQVMMPLTNTLQAENEALRATLAAHAAENSVRDAQNEALQAALDARETELDHLRAQQTVLREHIDALRQQAQALAAQAYDPLDNEEARRELERIHSLRAWRALQSWYRLKAWVLPAGSHRERAYHLLRSTAEIGTHQGLGAVGRRMRRWLRGERRYYGQTHPLEMPIQASLSQSSSATPVSAPVSQAAPLPDEGLMFGLDFPLDVPIAIGAGTEIMVGGWTYHPQSRITRLTVLLGDQRHPVMHFPLMRIDVRDAFPEHAEQHGGVLNSGFRTSFSLTPIKQAQTLTMGLEAVLESGEVVTQTIRTLHLQPDLARVPATLTLPATSEAEAQPLVVICMATYNADERYFREQLDSIRAQTHRRWLCLIQDDASDESYWAVMQALLGDDPRFIVERNQITLGFYRNFEACLARVPAEATYVALSDQDDVWDAKKLSTLLAAMTPETMLVFSDQIIVDAEGRHLSKTAWQKRDPQWTEIDHLLIANTITGAASLFRTELLTTALPFPPVQPNVYHDQWLGLVALARGSIAYVPQGLMRYRQHHGNVIGWMDDAQQSPPRLAALVRQAARFADASSPAFDLIQAAHYLCYISLWARIVQRRHPQADPRIREQLAWVAEMDTSPRRLRQWITTRGNQPRVLLNREWYILYSLVTEQVMARAGAREWQRFNQSVQSMVLPAAPLKPQVRQSARIRQMLGEYQHLARRLTSIRLDVRSHAPRRVNILLAEINFEIVFGGYLGMFHLARRLAESGVRVRLVVVDGALNLGQWRQDVRAYPGLETLFDQVEVASVQNRAQPLPVHPDDTFIATNAWLAHLAHAACQELHPPTFIFLVQEYEPLFYAHSTESAFVASAYDLPHHALFSTHLLRDFFRQRQIGVFAPSATGESIAFENAIALMTDPPASRERYRLLFYARPEAHAQRNAFLLGLIALTKAIEAGLFDLSRWTFYGVGAGESSAPIALARGAQLHLIPRMTLQDYQAMLPRYDLGLSLMLSPHPSLVPLDMAAAGLITVTNTFENKTADSLRAISPNLIGAAPTPDALVKALQEGAARVMQREARLNGMHLNWARTWEEAYNDDVLAALHQWLDTERETRAVLYDGLRFAPSMADEGLTLDKRLVPPRDLIAYVQPSDDPVAWAAVGREFLHYSRVLADLEPTHSVLDVGCGAGRIAIALREYLSAEGCYEGFDIHVPSITWAQEAYRELAPNFHFQAIDLYNSAYNPNGTVQSEALTFPYADASFDLIILTSVFTHMLPAGVARYWQEMARTLKPGGYALVTAFLLTADSRPRLATARNTIPLSHNHGLYRVQSEEDPERVIAYEAEAMLRMIAEAGLTLAQVYEGAWCGRSTFLSYQDIMIVRRAE